MISLGIDIGGTGCKCVAFRDDGTQCAISYLEYPNPSGTVNLSPIVLREAVFSVTHRCVRQLSDASEVCAITVSSFGESFVPTGADGEALSDILLYFANSESEQFDDLVKTVGAARFMEITRLLPDASYSLSKMLYTEKTAHAPVARYLFVASYLCWCLCGEAVCDVSLACRSLLYDVKNGCWSQELLAASGIREAQLPTVLPSGSIAGKLLPHVAAQLGLSRDVAVVIGSHDQIVNALGAGVASSGDAADISGTCECIVPLFSQMPDLDFVRSNFACVPYLHSGGYVTYAYNISGGSVVRWYRDTLAAHLRTDAQQRACSIYDLLNETCPQEPTNLLMLPFLQGMGGTPDVSTSATGVICGLRASSTLPELYRGILEGLCYEMRYNLETLALSGIRPTRLFACGGGARSRAWLQVKADIWDCEIVPVQIDETGALGSAILGFAAVSGEKDCIRLARRFTRHAQPVLPNPAHHAFYQAQYEKYKALRNFCLQTMY